MKGGRRAVGGEQTSEHLQSEVAERLAAQVLLAQREAMMSSREQWVPPLAPYEKGVTPTEMKRASDGSGKQPFTRDGRPVRRDGMPGPSDSYSRAATGDEDTDSEDEGGGKRPMHSRKGGKGLMSLQASQEQRQEQPENQLDELEHLADKSEDDLRWELIRNGRQPQPGESLRSLRLRVLLLRAQLPDYTNEEALVDVQLLQEKLEFLVEARRQRDELRAEVEDRMDEYVTAGYDYDGYSAHMAAAIQYEELVTSLSEQLQENLQALVKLQEQQLVALDDMYRRARRPEVTPLRKGAAMNAEQAHAAKVKKLEEQVRLLESWREEPYDHMFSMKWTKSTWLYGDGKKNSEGTYNGYGQDNKERFLYPKWKKQVKAMYDNLPDPIEGFLVANRGARLDEMIQDNTSNPFNLDKATPSFLEDILQLAKRLNTVFTEFRNGSYLKERKQGRHPHDPEQKEEIEKWGRMINEKFYPNRPLDKNPYTSMSASEYAARRVQQEKQWYKERVKIYLRLRGELADTKFTLDALRRQVEEEGREFLPYENEMATARMKERDHLLTRAEAAFQALKYDEKGNVKQMYKDLPDEIKWQMGDRRGDGGIWGLTPKEALKVFE